MKTILTSVKIWMKTVAFNAIILGALPSDVGEELGFCWYVLILIGGLMITWPLLTIINPLIKVSMRLPYSSAARIAWLFLFLVILIMLFYLLAWVVFSEELSTIKAIFYMTGVTSAALLIAVLTTLKSLNKLNTQ